MSVTSVWQEALSYIQGKVPKQVYDTWFTPVHLERIEESTAQIAVPNKFLGDWLNQHYAPLLAEAVANARGGGDMAVTFIVFQRQVTRPPDGVAAASATIIGRTPAPVRPKRGVQLN